MLFCTDAATLGSTRTTRDGYLVADVAAGRTGIQTYAGSEVRRPDLAVARIYRPEDEVFSADAMASAAHRPLTLDHPVEMVSAENWRVYAVGFTGGTVARDGDHLKLPVACMDADTIRAVEGGKRELSLGYTCDLDWTAGTTPSGDSYDAVQRNIRINHLAIVSRGRAGSACRIGDAWPSEPSSTPLTTKEPRIMPDNLRAVLVDGVSYQITDQGAQLIERLQSQLTDARRAADGKEGQIAALADAHRREIEQRDGTAAGVRAEQDKAIQAKDGEIAALRLQIPDAPALDALVEARTRTVTAAKTVLGATFDARGKTDAAIKREAVAKRLGEAAVRDRSDDYVGACFDTLTLAGGSAQRDPVRDAIAGVAFQPLHTADAARSAWEERQERDRNAWRHAPHKEAV